MRWMYWVYLYVFAHVSADRYIRMVIYTRNYVHPFCLCPPPHSRTHTHTNARHMRTYEKCHDPDSTSSVIPRLQALKLSGLHPTPTTGSDQSSTDSVRGVHSKLGQGSALVNALPPMHIAWCIILHTFRHACRQSAQQTYVTV